MSGSLPETIPVTTPSGVSREFLLSWYEAWNRRDWDFFLHFLSDRFVLEEMSFGTRHDGKIQHLNYLKSWAQTIPDGKIRVERISGSGLYGETILVEYILTGTRPIPPSNQLATLHFCDLLRFEHDRLVFCRSYSDVHRVFFAEGEESKVGGRKPLDRAG